MKTNFVTTAVSILLFTTVTMQCMAQPDPPARPRREPAPREAQQPLQQIVAFTGTVNEWVNNDDYVYDGFYLQSTAGKLLVKFPPHLGAQLVKVIKAGNTITVNGVDGVNPDGIREIRMVNINAGGQTIVDTPPAAPPVPEAESAITGSGKITGLRMDREGRVNGFIVDSKTIIRTPPHVAAQLNGLVSTGATVSYTGFKKPAGNGEAMAGNYTVIRCQTITVNGTQYLTD